MEKERFPLPELLNTESLLIRPLVLEDLESFFLISSEEGPMEMMGRRHASNKEEAEEELKRWIDKKAYALVLSGEETLVGVLSLEPKPLEGYERFRQAKVEIFVGPSHWGKGYGSQAIKELAYSVFQWGLCDLIWAEAGDFNRAAIKMLDHAGFRLLDHVKDTKNVDILESDKLGRYVLFDIAPRPIDAHGEVLPQPEKIVSPEFTDDVEVSPMTEEEYQKYKEEESTAEALAKEAARLAEIEAQEIAKKKAEEEARLAKEKEEKERIELARQSLDALVKQGIDNPEEPVSETQKKEEPRMPVQQPDPINIEITEDQTVIMEINGVPHVLYQGKPKAKPVKKAVAKPAPKKAPAKPAPKKAEPKKVEPKKVEPKKPVKKSPVPPKRNKPMDPTRDFAKFGPGLTDDSQHSIHTLSFEEKVDKAPKDIRKKYKELSKYLTEEFGCSHRVSFGYDSYRVGKKVVIALSLGGVHLRVNAAIDPKVYKGTRMAVNDDSASKKYKDLPAYIKVMGDKSFKQAFRLIDDTMKSLGVKKVSK